MCWEVLCTQPPFILSLPLLQLVRHAGVGLHIWDKLKGAALSVLARAAWLGVVGLGGSCRYHPTQMTHNIYFIKTQTHAIFKSVDHLHCLGQNNLLLIVFSKQCWWGVGAGFDPSASHMHVSDQENRNCWVDLHKVLPPSHLACRYPPAANSSPPMCRYKYVTVEYKMNENLWKLWVSCATCAGK